MNPTIPTPEQPRRSSALHNFAALAVVTFMAACTVQYLAGLSGGPTAVDDSPHPDETGACNVQGLELRGVMYTYVRPQYDENGDLVELDATASEEIVGRIRQAEEDDEIKAIMLDVDSPGGDPVAAEEIANALRAAEKPTVAIIRSIGTSAAYWAATGADVIFASENSTVGSIGATMSYLENAKRNEDDGLRFVDLASGKFKDAGNPDKPLTEEERELFLRDVRKLADSFVRHVARNRNLDEDSVRKYADGSSVLGSAALDAKLIDRIGSFAEAEAYLREKTGEDATVCW